MNLLDLPDKTLRQGRRRTLRALGSLRLRRRRRRLARGRLVSPPVLTQQLVPPARVGLPAGQQRRHPLGRLQQLPLRRHRVHLGAHLYRSGRTVHRRAQTARHGRVQDALPLGGARRLL